MSELLEGELTPEQREQCAAGDAADRAADGLSRDDINALPVAGLHRVMQTWPADIVTYSERRAYLRGLSDCESLAGAMRAILAEVGGGQRPFSGDSYLPGHLTDAAQAALDGYDSASRGAR